jgi:hypothetical protein
MYKITTHENHMLVKFNEDFTCSTIRTIIRHETLLPQYTRMNDIWLIGKYHALVTLDHLESMAADFKCLCPRNASRKKTAIVVNEGLTEAIILLWVKQPESRIPFELRVFHTLAEAKEWLGIAESKVA